MKLKTLLIGLSTAMLTLTPFINSVTPPANAGVVREIQDATIGQLRKSQNREGFVKGLANKAFYFHKGRYNVMVFNLSQGYENRLQGVQYFKQVNYNGVVYGLWVFKKGDFKNTGDGGYINWAFIGSFERSENGGKLVKFTARS